MWNNEGLGQYGVSASSGALNVNDNGRLRANYYNDNDNPNNWAAGAAPAAELLSPLFFIPLLVGTHAF